MSLPLKRDAMAAAFNDVRPMARTLAESLQNLVSPLVTPAEAGIHGRIPLKSATHGFPPSRE